MESLILHNISIKIDTELIIDKLSLEIKKKTNTSIIGPAGVGKTTFCKLLNGDLKFKGKLKINNQDIDENNINLLKKYVAVVLSNSYNKNALVIDELFNGLDTLDLDYEEEEKKVKEVISFFKLDDKLESKINTFTIQEKYFIKIIKELIRSPEYIVFDDIFINMNKSDVKKIINYCNINNITIINITTEMEFVLESDYLLVLYDKNIAMEGKVLECLKEEQLLRRLGFNLPFLVDLSIQLGYYGLIDKIITNDRKMIDAIWK